MKTADFLTILDNEITQVIKEYDNSPESLDTSGTRISHVLDTVTTAEKLWALNDGLIAIALVGQPRDLYEETATSSEIKLYDVDQVYFVRKPAVATNGASEDLDMSEGLVNAVLYHSVFRLDSKQTGHYKKSVDDVKSYLKAYSLYDAV